MSDYVNASLIDIAAWRIQKVLHLRLIGLDKTEKGWYDITVPCGIVRVKGDEICSR